MMVGDKNLEGSPNGMAPLLKSGGRKPLEVRLLYPPPVILLSKQMILYIHPEGIRTMKYQLVKNSDIFKKEKLGIKIGVYPVIGNCEVVVVETETGHNQEFYDKASTLNYIILEGSGSFFLDDEEVKVSQGDFISIQPKTLLYYKGKMKLILITTPPWAEENEVETKPTIW